MAELGGYIIYDRGDKDIESFQDWLKKYRPSRQDLSSYAWIAVRGKKMGSTQGHSFDMGTDDDLPGSLIKTQAFAIQLAHELAERCSNIDNDPSIPVRASKANPNNKKKLREVEHETVANRLKNLAIDRKVTAGKWLFYPKQDAVDATWEKIAKAVVEEDGCLYGTVYTAKVSTYQPPTVGQGEEASHVICVFVDDSWNKDAVGAVFKSLVARLGLVSNAYKADIYTCASIDSKHPSKIKSTLYNKKDFMTDQEVADALEALKPKPKEVVRKQAKGTAFIDDDDSASEDDKPATKKAK